MKKITKISVENSRAYFDEISFELPKGENLLLYGENGSGKTSLYKALSDFIQSFYSPITYTPNWNKPIDASGHITLCIGEYDAVAKNIVNSIELSFSPGVDNTTIPNTSYLRALSLSKGFLNYKDLLKVYLYEEKNPNLFEFFVLQLLKHYIPLTHGWTNSFYSEWGALNSEIFNVYNRNEIKHRRGLRKLKKFELGLKAVLDDLFNRTNVYLSKYFANFALNIDFLLRPLELNYGKKKRDWRIHQELKLKIEMGNSLINAYNEGLNEARLSAIAICLYLAALRVNPGSDMYLLFLDDIFIGIDSANRLPILEILRNEFSDFQIIISTYDRSWYYMAKNYILRHAPQQWKFGNLFSVPKTINDKSFMIPVKTDGTSSYDRAKEYLHGQRNIDLPASANYFRKTLEELLSESYLPKELFLNEDYSVIPGFKLTQRLEALGHLFNKIGEDSSHINILQSYLHPLIHPLSHYEEEAQIYRAELVLVEQSINNLIDQIAIFYNKCQLILAKGNKLIINYNQPDGKYAAKYHILLEDNIWLYKSPANLCKFTDAKCRMIYMEGINNGINQQPYHPTKNMTKFQYKSLDDALQKIFEYEVNTLHHGVIAHNDYDIVNVVKNGGTECITVRRNVLRNNIK